MRKLIFALLLLFPPGLAFSATHSSPNSSSGSPPSSARVLADMKKVIEYYKIHHGVDPVIPPYQAPSPDPHHNSSPRDGGGTVPLDPTQVIVVPGGYDFIADKTFLHCNPVEDPNGICQLAENNLTAPTIQSGTDSDGNPTYSSFINFEFFSSKYYGYVTSLSFDLNYTSPQTGVVVYYPEQGLDQTTQTPVSYSINPGTQHISIAAPAGTNLLHFFVGGGYEGQTVTSISNIVLGYSSPPVLALDPNFTTSNSSYTATATQTTEGPYPIVNYSWTVQSPGGSTASSTTTTNTLPLSFTAGGDYVITVKAFDGVGYSNVATQTINFSSNTFSPSISVDNSNPTLGDTVHLTAVISGGTPPYEYTWSITQNAPGNTDQIVTSDGSARFSPTATGSYTVSLNVSDSSGNSGSTTAQIQMNSVNCGISGNVLRLPQGPSQNGPLYGPNTFNAISNKDPNSNNMAQTGCNIAATMMAMHYYYSGAFALKSGDTINSSTYLFSEWEDYRQWMADNNGIPDNNEVTWAQVPAFYNYLCNKTAPGCAASPAITYQSSYVDPNSNLNVVDDGNFGQLSQGAKFTVVKHFVCNGTPLILRVPSVSSGTPSGHSVLAIGLSTNADGTETVNILDPSGRAYPNLDALENEIDGIRPLVPISQNVADSTLLSVSVTGNVNISVLPSVRVKEELTKRGRAFASRSSPFIYQNDTATDATNAGNPGDQLQTLSLYNPPAGEYSISVSAVSQNENSQPYKVAISQFDPLGSLVSIQKNSGVTGATPTSISYTAPSSFSYGVIQAGNVSITYGDSLGTDRFSLKGKLVPTQGGTSYNLQTQATTINYQQMGIFLVIPAGEFIPVGGSYLYTNSSVTSGIKSVSVAADGSFEIQASGLNLLGVSQTAFGPVQVQIGSIMFTGQPVGQSAVNAIARLSSDSLTYSIGAQGRLAVNVTSAPTDPEDEYVFEATWNGQPVGLYRESATQYSFTTPVLTSAGLETFSVISFVQNKKKTARLREEIASFEKDMADAQRVLLQETNPQNRALLQARINNDEVSVDQLRHQEEEGRTKVGSEMNLYLRVD